MGPRQPTLVVRAATRQDAERVADIAWRSWEAAYGHFIPQADRRAFFAGHYTDEEHQRSVDDPSALYLVAERDGAPAAFLLAFDQRRGVHLDRLYADPMQWRRGAGQALWGALSSWAASRGARRIVLEVAVDGESGPRFYEKQGCRRLAEALVPVGSTLVRVARYEFVLSPRQER